MSPTTTTWGNEGAVRSIATSEGSRTIWAVIGNTQVCPGEVLAAFEPPRVRVAVQVLATGDQAANCRNTGVAAPSPGGPDRHDPVPPSARSMGAPLFPNSVASGPEMVAWSINRALPVFWIVGNESALLNCIPACTWPKSMVCDGETTSLAAELQVVPTSAELTGSVGPPSAP